MSAPDEIVPAGFSQQRIEYLYNEIRQFCKKDLEDFVAPCPANKKLKTWFGGCELNKTAIFIATNILKKTH